MNHEILKNSMLFYRPACGSWWRPGECFRTRWQHQRTLQTFQLSEGWWLCRGCHLVFTRKRGLLSCFLLVCGNYLHDLMIHTHTHLCTSSSVKSWRRSGWPGWSLASTRWLLGPDTSPSVLHTHQNHQFNAFSLILESPALKLINFEDYHPPNERCDDSDRWELMNNLRSHFLCGRIRTVGGSKTSLTSSPSVLTISLTPWKKPLYFGFADVWSWMNFT